jgi:DNA-directed RNA polymerase specialized sigma24 family protein
MALAQNGNREAFHTLFKDIGPFMTRSLQRRLPAREVEDICQEILIAMCKSRHTISPTGHLSPGYLQ